MTHLRRLLVLPGLILLFLLIQPIQLPAFGAASLDGYTGGRVEGIGNRGAKVSIGEFHGAHTGKSYWIYRKFGSRLILIDLFRVKDSYTYRCYGYTPYNLAFARVGDLIRVPVYAPDLETDSMFYLTLAEDFFSQGRFELAFEQLLLSLERDRNNCQALALASLRQLGIGLTREARDIARRALKAAEQRTRPVDRWSVMALGIAGAAEFECGSPSAAVRALSRAIEQGAEDDARGAAVAGLMKGLVLMAEGYEDYGRLEIEKARKDENAILDLSLFAPRGSGMAKWAEKVLKSDFRPIDPLDPTRGTDRVSGEH